MEFPNYVSARPLGDAKYELTFEARYQNRLGRWAHGPTPAEKKVDVLRGFDPALDGTQLITWLVVEPTTMTRFFDVHVVDHREIRARWSGSQSEPHWGEDEYLTLEGRDEFLQHMRDCRHEPDVAEAIVAAAEALPENRWGEVGQ